MLSIGLKMNPELFSLMLFMCCLTLPPILGQVQLQFPFLPRERSCPPHTPTPVDDSYELSVCREEVAAARELKDPSEDKRTDELVVEHDYLLEKHQDTSEDGYISNIFRVPGSRQSPRRLGKPSVLLFHGFGCSSDAWFAQPSDKNLVFKLVDAGYDVWVADGRGTDNSQRHLSLNADKDLSYWDFSFHEMGIHDLPPMIDLILERSGNEKIFYIGHSQGFTIYLVGASEIPGFNDKIHASFLMAPGAYLGQSYIRSINRGFVPIVYTPLEDIVVQLARGHLDLRAPSSFLNILGIDIVDICSVRAVQCDLCDVALFALLDFNPHQANYTNTPNAVRVLNTASLKDLIHFSQNILSCLFRKYDYGPAQNLEMYGTAEPPSYDLGNLTAPLHIYYSEQDSFIPPPDIGRLVNDIRPEALKEVHLVNDPTFDHFDFLTARDADTLVYNRIINSMMGYL